MLKRFPLHSIRWKLPLTYAGIALLTALALGAALLLPLRSYYQDRERQYLTENARSIAVGVAPLLVANEKSAVPLEEHIRLLGMLSQTRVVVLGPDEQLLADSGTQYPGQRMVIRAQNAPMPGPGEKIATDPAEKPGASPGGLVLSFVGEASVPVSKQVFAANQAGEKLQFFYEPALAKPAEGIAQPGQPADVLVSMIPLSSTIFGFALNADPGAAGSDSAAGARSNEKFMQPVFHNGQLAGWVYVSEGPAYGREIVSEVAQGWAAASLVAVLVAGAAGWWVSRRMTAPVLELTEVTRRMAGGDLSARVDLRRADEIGSLGLSFNEMASQIERMVQALRQFAADAAHEMHTPLTALRTNLELASGTIGRNEFLDRAAGQLARMESLTNDLLDLSRIESGATAGEGEVFDLCSLVAQTCEFSASRAEQAGLEFTLDLPEAPAPVRGLPGQIRRAVSNLAENALKFTPPGGEIRVQVQVEETRALVRVVDSGIGIPEEELPLLFNRFHRARNAAGYPGSGLGLAITRAIAEAHGGSVWAECARGKTCFTLALPLAGSP